jgi:transaldolase
MPKIFYDGCEMKYASYPNVVGFTTNTTIMRQSNQLNYSAFYNKHRDLVAGRPLSFQTFSDDATELKEQSRLIYSIGPNLYVKIPVITSTGVSNMDTIVELLQEGVQVNITAVFTTQQLDMIATKLPLDVKTPTIVSVFGGRISDTGVYPKDVIQYAVTTFKPHTNVEILWAGCKDNLVLQQADEVGCHIVTLPDAIISRINRIGQSLDNLSQDTVASFLKDAKEGQLSIM